MIRKLFLAVGLAALVTLPLHAQDSATVAKAVNDLEGQWAVSLAAGNWTAVGTFLAPDYMATDGTGKRMNRTDYLASLSDAGTFSNVTNGAYTVVVSGNTAVHLGEGTFTVKSKKGKVSHIHQVWTDTWVRQANDMWLCVASQWVEHKLK
jgi:ketosteroid isomerase-like protein